EHHHDAARRQRAGARRADASTADPVVRRAREALRSGLARLQGRAPVRRDLPDLGRGAERHRAVHLFPVLRWPMGNSAETEHTGAQGSARPIRTAAIIIYATFALLILSIPQSLSNWLRDMEESPMQQVLLHAASGVQAAAQAVGLNVPYRRVRAALHAWTGK